VPPWQLPKLARLRDTRGGTRHTRKTLQLACAANRACNAANVNGTQAIQRVQSSTGTFCTFWDFLAWASAAQQSMHSRRCRCASSWPPPHPTRTRYPRCITSLGCRGLGEHPRKKSAAQVRREEYMAYVPLLWRHCTGHSLLSQHPGGSLTL
jgi:hypothetical protein